MYRILPYRSGSWHETQKRRASEFLAAREVSLQVELYVLFCALAVVSMVHSLISDSHILHHTPLTRMSRPPACLTYRTPPHPRSQSLISPPVLAPFMLDHPSDMSFDLQMIMNWCFLDVRKGFIQHGTFKPGVALWPPVLRKKQSLLWCFRALNTYRSDFSTDQKHEVGFGGGAANPKQGDAFFVAIDSIFPRWGDVNIPGTTQLGPWSVVHMGWATKGCSTSLGWTFRLDTQRMILVFAPLGLCACSWWNLGMQQQRIPWKTRPCARKDRNSGRRKRKVRIS